MTITGWIGVSFGQVDCLANPKWSVLCGYRQQERHESKNSSCALYRVCSRFAHHLALLNVVGARAFVAGAQSGRHSK
jgi:hypothetical protein